MKKKDPDLQKLDPTKTSGSATLLRREEMYLCNQFRYKIRHNYIVIKLKLYVQQCHNNSSVHKFVYKPKYIKHARKLFYNIDICKAFDSDDNKFTVLLLSKDQEGGGVESIPPPSQRFFALYSKNLLTTIPEIS